MSEFEKLASFLRPPDSTDGKNNLVPNGLIEARKRAQPLVVGCMETLRHYYEATLKSATDLQEILKKKEEPRFNPWQSHNSPYVYEVNFVPDDLPDGNKHSGIYSDPKRMDLLNWHPNVALQFRLSLTDNYSKKAQKITRLEPSIQLNVWGAIAIDIPPRGVSLSHLYLTTYDKPYTMFNINGNIDNPQLTVDSLSKALKIITLQVLEHKKFIRSL